MSVRNPQIGKMFGLNDYLAAREKENSIEAGTPIIWVDDVATEMYVNQTEAEHEWRKESHPVPLDNYPALVIQTNPKWGISRAELKQIQEFGN